MRIRRQASVLFLGVALTVAGFGFLEETGGAVASFDGKPVNIVPFFWRFGMAPAERLAQCLEAARPLLPDGSVVAFASADGPEQADFFRWRWAAYLLPTIHLVPLAERRVEPPARFVLTYRVQIDEQGLLLLRQLPGGRLYKVLD